MKKYVDDKQGDSPNLIAFERLWNATSRAWENACGREDQRKLYHDLAELVDHLESNDLRNGHMHAILDDNLNCAGFVSPLSLLQSLESWCRLTREPMTA